MFREEKQKQKICGLEGAYVRPRPVRHIERCVYIGKMFNSISKLKKKKTKTKKFKNINMKKKSKSKKKKKLNKCCGPSYQGLMPFRCIFFKEP